MVSAREAKAALVLLTDTAVSDSQKLLASVDGSFEDRRLQLLDAVPSLISYYADGSSALAADFYDDERERWEESDYTAIPIVDDRIVPIRRAVAWASEPLRTDDIESAGSRLSEVVNLETARPFRSTILHNFREDDKCIGWQRNTNGGCKLCRMLADRGAVYKETTARFAAHPHCKCSANPVFLNGPDGPEASVMQYIASRRKRTASHRAMVREYLNANYEDFHG